MSIHTWRIISHLNGLHSSLREIIIQFINFTDYIWRKNPAQKVMLFCLFFRKLEMLWWNIFNFKEKALSLGFIMYARQVLRALFVVSYHSAFHFFPLSIIYFLSFSISLSFCLSPFPQVDLQRQRAASRRRPFSGGKQVGKSGCRT